MQNWNLIDYYECLECAQDHQEEWFQTVWHWQCQVHDPDSVEPPVHLLSVEHNIHTEYAIDGTVRNISWKMQCQMVTHQSCFHLWANNTLHSSTYAY